MFVLIHHEVRDPATFWNIVTEEIEKLPEGIVLLQSLPSRFGTAEFSLWQTDRVEALQQFVDSKLNLVCHSTFIPIDAGNAFGLPLPAPTPA